MRSSWLASATNRRTRVSLSWRARRAEATCSSIRFSAVPTCPTSVPVSVSGSGTRTASATSPRSSGSWVTRRAVPATRPSGRSASRTVTVAARAIATSPDSATPVMTRVSCSMVA